MGWSSASDEDTNEKKPNPVDTGPSKEILISDSDENHDFGWDSDEAEGLPVHAAIADQPKKVSEAGPSHTNWVPQFVAMRFSERLVAKAIEQNVEGDPDGILETLLTYTAIEKSHSDHEKSPAHCSVASVKGESDDDFSDVEYFEFEDVTDDFAKKDKIVSTLVDMGFLAEEASSAVDRCATLSSSRPKIPEKTPKPEDDDLWGAIAAPAPRTTAKSLNVRPSSSNDEDDLWGSIAAPPLRSAPKPQKKTAINDDNDPWAAIAAPSPTTRAKPLSLGRGRGAKAAPPKLGAQRMDRTSS